MKNILVIFLFNIICNGQTFHGNDDTNQFEKNCKRNVFLSKNGKVVALGIKSFKDDKVSNHIKVFKNEFKTWIQMGQSIEIGDSYVESSSLALSNDGKVIALIDSKEIRSKIKIFKYKFENWVQIGEDIQIGESYFSGHISISMSENGAIVAAGCSKTHTNGNYSGSVEIYKNESEKWIQIGNQINGLEHSFSGFNICLSEKGNILAIESPGKNIFSVYKNELQKWVKIGVDIKRNFSNDRSAGGLSLSSDGNILAIGEINAGFHGNTSFIKVYENKSGIWVQKGQNIITMQNTDRRHYPLWNTDTTSYIGSDHSISLSKNGDIIAIGSPFGGGFGYVNVYKFNSGKWIQIGEKINGLINDDFFGYSTSLSNDGNVLAVSGSFNIKDQSFSSCRVRVYENILGKWVQIGNDLE